MTNIFWILGNAFLIILILLRVPSPKATFTTIDKNPKILDFALKSLTIVYLTSNSYLNIYN
jgi:hypothetical protein